MGAQAANQVTQVLYFLQTWDRTLLAGNASSTPFSHCHLTLWQFVLNLLPWVVSFDSPHYFAGAFFTASKDHKMCLSEQIVPLADSIFQHYISISKYYVAHVLTQAADRW